MEGHNSSEVSKGARVVQSQDMHPHKHSHIITSSHPHALTGPIYSSDAALDLIIGTKVGSYTDDGDPWSPSQKLQKLHSSNLEYDAVLSRMVTSVADLRRFSAGSHMMKAHANVYVNSKSSLNYSRTTSLPMRSLENDGILILYVSGWKTPHLHYKETEKEWGQLPGKQFTKLTPQNSKFQSLIPTWIPKEALDRMWFVFIPNTQTLECVPTDGGLGWDKDANGSNYHIRARGLYFIYEGQLYNLEEPPSKPALLRCEESGNSYARIVWNPPTIRFDQVEKYTVYRDEVFLVSVDCNTREYTDEQLLPGQVYAYRVHACNSNGHESPPSDTAFARIGTPGKPSSPRDLVCQKHGVDSILLGWLPPVDHGNRPIMYYRIYKNAQPFAFVSSTDSEMQTFNDTRIVSGCTYTYRVSAWHDLPALGEEVNAFAHDKSGSSGTYTNIPFNEKLSFEAQVKSKGLNCSSDKVITDKHMGRGNKAERKAYRGANWKHKGDTQQYTMNQDSIETIETEHNEADKSCLIEGLLSNPVSVTAEVMLKCPRLDDERIHIMLQGFNWQSSKNQLGWYNILSQHVSAIKTLGATIVWMPPPTECVGWEGYMPTRWYNLNSRYGSFVELTQLIADFAKVNISCAVDLVANHRCAVEQDHNSDWTIYEAPSWGPWAVVKNNLQGYSATGAADTGCSVECAPDIDHTNPQVQLDIQKWTKWLMQRVGYTAFRIDMAGGYAAKYQRQFIDRLGRPFAVGEYWDGNAQNLANYVHEGQGALSAFDFAFYYELQRAVESDDFASLNVHGRLNGLVGMEPHLAVTFVENHDTDHLDYCRKFCDGDLDGVLQGYAVILTHPGTPSIYWDHWSDYGDYSRESIEKMCSIRISKGITSRSGVYIDRAEKNLYAAYVSPGVQLSTPESASVAVKVGGSQWFPQGATWTIAADGFNFCIWTR